jgi:hypothetical protein
MRSTRSPRRGRAAAALVAAVAGCSYSWTSVIPAGPRVVPRRGSPVVTFETCEQRFSMRHEPSSFWSPGGEHMEDAKIVPTSHHDLDVRTCKMSWRWSAPSGPEPDGSDVPLAERGTMGPLRFSLDDSKTKLIATDPTGEHWVAAKGFGNIVSVTTVPAARRVVMLTDSGAIFVYDADAHRVQACGDAR